MLPSHDQGIDQVHEYEFTSIESWSPKPRFRNNYGTQCDKKPNILVFALVFLTLPWLTMIRQIKNLGWNLSLSIILPHRIMLILYLQRSAPAECVCVCVCVESLYEVEKCHILPRGNIKTTCVVKKTDECCLLTTPHRQDFWHAIRAGWVRQVSRICCKPTRPSNWHNVFLV